MTSESQERYTPLELISLIRQYGHHCEVPVYQEYSPGYSPRGADINGYYGSVKTETALHALGRQLETMTIKLNAVQEILSGPR